MKGEGGPLKCEKKSEWVFSNFTLLSSNFLTAVKRTFVELGI